jgi:ribosomal protein S18 acetylase RimI-like enzyme
MTQHQRQARPTSKDINIRLLGPADASLFDWVADGVFDEPVSKERLAIYLKALGHFFIAALADGMIVGQCAAVIHRHPDKPTELYINELGVADAYLRRGIGGKMLDAMLALGKEYGCEEAWLGTEPDNIAARALYASRADPPEDFVLYCFDLVDPGFENHSRAGSDFR